MSLQVLLQIQTGEKRKLQNLLEIASLFLSSEAQPWCWDGWLAIAHSVPWGEQGTVRRPYDLSKGDAFEENWQPLLLNGNRCDSQGAAEGAHLQKRLGMHFLLPFFPCFHGNSNKQEQPALNFVAYRSGTPAQSSRQTLALEDFRPILTRWIPCLQGELTTLYVCIPWQNKSKRHKPSAGRISVAALCAVACTLIVAISAFYSGRDCWRK